MNAGSADLAHNGGMAVTVVLADGFAGEGVEVVAGGRTHQVGPVHTSPLTGMAREVVVDAVPHGQAARRIPARSRSPPD